VYLRYHYVTDLIVGMALGLAVYRWGPGIAEAIIVGDKYPGDYFGMIPCREKESPSG